MKWRAFVLAAAVVCLGFSTGIREQTLREAARGSGLLIGTAVRSTQLSEEAYASTLEREFNMVEPEDELKWEVVHPERESFDFSQADRIVDFAATVQHEMRGHTLVWHQQNPSWLTQGRFTSDQLAKLLKAHIKTVVGHYRGRVFAWDVVALGVQVQITAMDVALPVDAEGNARAEDLQRQADIYGEVANACLRIAGALRSRPGGSRTSIPGSCRTRSRRKARACCWIGTIGPSRHMRALRKALEAGWR